MGLSRPHTLASETRSANESWDSDSCSGDSTQEGCLLLHSLPAQQIQYQLLTAPCSNPESLTRLVVTQSNIPAFCLDLVLTLPRLQQLDLSRNAIASVTIKEGCPSIASSLTQLILSQNRLSTLPSSLFARLPHLRSLFLYANRLTALPPSVSVLSALCCLHVFANQLTALPRECASLSYLREVTLGTVYGGNPLCIHSWAPDLSLLTSLTRLALTNTPVTSLPQGFIRFPCYALDSSLQSLPLRAPSRTESAVQTASWCPPSYPHQSADAVPEAFYCPITMAILKDPVVASDGFTYERAEIYRWVKLGRPASPMTNRPLSSIVLHPNRILISWMKEFFEKNPHLRPVEEVKEENGENVMELNNNSSDNRGSGTGIQSQSRQSPARGSAAYNTTPPSIQRNRSATSLTSSPSRGSHVNRPDSPPPHGPRNGPVSCSPGFSNTRNANAPHNRNVSRPRSAR